MISLIRRSSALAGIALLLSLQLASASNNATPSASSIDPANFVDAIDNPYFPLTPGTTFIYEGQTDGLPTRDEMTVTSGHKTILGVECIVVHDVAFEDGEIVEDTLDWFAQDMEGNVWYFGEASTTYEDGNVVDTHGSWEAGVNGAAPGIAMPAHPAVGDSYYQEYLVGTAEDEAEVIALGESTTVKSGTYSEVVRIKEWSALDPGITEHKSYAPGVGLILSEAVEGENERAELVEIVMTDPAPPATPAG